MCTIKIETIIMNVFRGSGISGLRGIEPVRDNKFIRPLIENNYIYRDGNAKSPSTLIHLSDDTGSNRKI